MTGGVDPFGETRVADVDPGTGVERRSRRADADATVVRALRPSGGPAPDKITARFVPGVGASAAGESTTAWDPGGRRGFPLRPRVGARSVRVAALGAALVAAAALALSAAPGEPATARESARPAAGKAKPGPSPAPGGREEEKPGVAAREGARLVDLVEALSEGRLDDARELCRALAASSPGDAALREAARILARSPGEGAR